MSNETNHNASEFPDTSSSIMDQVVTGDPEQRQEALAKFLNRYWAPLHAYVMRKLRISPADADDLVQGFITDRILEGALLSRVDRSLGSRFRSFLLKVLNNYLIDQLRKKRRDPKLGIEAAASIADDHPEALDRFCHEWAFQVIQFAVNLMRDQCAKNGRSDMWEVFEHRILRPNLEGVAPMGYGEFVQRFNLATVKQATNVQVNSIRMFERCLRAIIAEYVGKRSDIEDELADLQAILSHKRRDT